MITTIIYGLRAKGANIDPTQPQHLELIHAPYSNMGLEETKEFNEREDATVSFEAMAAVTLGESVCVEPIDAEAQADEGMVQIIKERVAEGLHTVMSLMHSELSEVELENRPSISEFLETCFDQKVMIYKIEEINLLKDEVLSEKIDVTAQLRLDCVGSYKKSMTIKQ